MAYTTLNKMVTVFINNKMYRPLQENWKTPRPIRHYRQSAWPTTAESQHG